MDNRANEHNSYTTAIASDESGFNSIVRNYSVRLEKIAFHITGDQPASEDIVQESFLKLWQQRGCVEVQYPAAWLYKVVSNAAYKHLKREAVKHRLVKHLLADSRSSHNEVEEQLTRKEMAACLNKACEKLPVRQREVYRLRLEKGLQRNEIASYLNISPNTVKVHLLRAHQFMKEHLAIVSLFLVFSGINILFFHNSNTGARVKDLYKLKSSNDFTNRKPIAQIQQHMGHPRYQY